jgi:hypothetical protein
MLTKEELQALEQRIAQNANKLVSSAKKVERKDTKDTRGRKPKQLHNKLLPVFQDLRLELFEDDGNSWPLWIDDVLSGVSRLDWYRQGERSVPLSTGSLKSIFESLEYIDSVSIADLLSLGERQARRYMQASILCYKYLDTGYKDVNIKGLKYPAHRPGVDKLVIADLERLEQLLTNK